MYNFFFLIGYAILLKGLAFCYFYQKRKDIWLRFNQLIIKFVFIQRILNYLANFLLNLWRNVLILYNSFYDFLRQILEILLKITTGS